MLSRLNSFLSFSTAFQIFTANMGISLSICAVFVFSFLTYFEFLPQATPVFTLPANSKCKVSPLQVKTSLLHRLPEWKRTLTFWNLNNNLNVPAQENSQSLYKYYRRTFSIHISVWMCESQRKSTPTLTMCKSSLVSFPHKSESLGDLFSITPLFLF